MRRGVAPPRRMRRRLTVAFALVAAAAAGGLALTSYLLVADARFDDSLRRAEREIDFGLGQAANLDPRSDLQVFAEGFEQRGVHALLLAGGGRFASDPSVSPPLPGELRALVAEGQVGFHRLAAGGARHVVVGGRPPGSNAELYLLLSEEAIHSDLGQLARVLAFGWLAVVALAALAGRGVAARTLAPVGTASRAAQAMAEGLLATRLPVTGADEFGQWAASFNEMAEALESKIRALQEAQARERRFTSDVAHEVRTPLTALVSEAALLREHLEAMPPEARRPAELLVADVARLRGLVEDLMEISRLDAGRERVRAEPLDLGKLVEATVRTRGWADRVDVVADQVAVRADRRRLERVVSNLVGNAIEHGGGRARVLVGAEGREAFVEVSDRGQGIPPEHLPHLFERFYKADPARSGGGSGLGLSIAAENARLLRGRIEAASEFGVGSRFTLRLPVSKPLHDGDGAVAWGNEDEGVAKREEPR